jgi:hypothetical protein
MEIIAIQMYGAKISGVRLTIPGRCRSYWRAYFAAIGD